MTAQEFCEIEKICTRFKNLDFIYIRSIESQIVNYFKTNLGVINYL